MRYFTIEELCRSREAEVRGIVNEPSASVRDNLVALVEHVLDPARTVLGTPIYVSSGYRCKPLNAAVGGSPNSQHLTGQAADISTGSKTYNQVLFDILTTQNNFDQLIWEQVGSRQWIHVSYKDNPRHERLRYDGKKYVRI